MVSGVCCTLCNLYIDEKCLKKAENRFRCKKLCNSIFHVEKSKIEEKEPEISDLTNGPFRLHKKTWSHHWIKGNLELDTFCFLCHNEICNSPSLNDFRCIWCLRNVHEECLNNISTPHLVEECDFGMFKKILLTPKLVIQTMRSSDLSLRDVRLDENLISSTFKNNPDEWTPLFVFANSKSGNNDAEAIIISLTTLLNPLQVFLLIIYGNINASC